ncbi:TetR family transcriptional regulator C-terminal domain-containing protein [Bosea sp. RAC05]|jgi:AcrR family transcriptional regulator|uniref:TetR family transcriptional regulator C-terminal domain-containing protein n=1 Tax=Bosea sp. RAC05 TaxID=1842539 RepID=UPI00083E6192|nr:TetR family transcriptional regulator C-terminal domain-containing protein [Bosea sp. RAC05]
MPASQRREAIIAASQKVLLAKGLMAATTRDVTEELGVGVGLLSHYFSWTDLRSLAFARIAQADLDSAIRQRCDVEASQVLRDVIATAFAESADPVWRLWIEATELAAADPSMSRVVAACTDQWWQALAGLFERGCVESAWSCGDPQGASWRIIALLQGLAGLTLAGDPRLTRAEATRHLTIAMEREYQALAGSPALSQTNRR